MSISRSTLCVVYALTGLAALIGTWGNNIQLLGGLSFVEGNVRFWQETLTNPASRSITVDILALSIGAMIWMFLEARRLNMRGVWFWMFFGLFVAMGAAFPFFLLHRERVLAKREAGAEAGTLSIAEIAFVVLIAAAVLAYIVLALRM